MQQLAGDDGIDRLAVAVGEAFQGQDLEASDAHFQVGQAKELGMASARSAPRAVSIASCGQKSMPNEASSPDDSVSP